MTILFLTVLVTLVLVTAGILIYMSFMSADRNGWRQLAATFRLRGKFSGKTRHFRTAIFNGFAFHGVLVIGVAEEGLMLRPAWLLRAFHPPLFLPWGKLTAKPFRRTHHSGYRLELRDAPGLVLEWSEVTHRLVEKYLPERSD